MGCLIVVEDCRHPFPMKGIQNRTIIQGDLFHVHTGSQISRPTDDEMASAGRLDKSNLGMDASDRQGKGA